MLCLNGQTSSSLTGRTSGLPKTELLAKAEKAPYPDMAPLSQYLMPGKDSEIALARSAAPKSISDEAKVMVLGPEGYTTELNGRNGFLCIVERSWGAATHDPDFWNPKAAPPFVLIRQLQGPLCPST
jgi:hypothetical protein